MFIHNGREIREGREKTERQGAAVERLSLGNQRCATAQPADGPRA